MARKSSSKIVAGGLIIVAILVGVLVWQPASEEVDSLKSDLATKESELASFQNDLADLVSLEAELPVAESERERILAAVPLGLNQDQLVENLSEIVDKVGMSLNSMTFSLQNTQATGADVVSISASITGNYNDLVTLLKEFESNDRVFNVTSIGVQLNDVSDEGYVMGFSLTLEAYYQE
ncbi:MAG: type 4a pilus biogenesis protein PilO [Candidatus Peregrinibacteria bacterium]|nr:type 4a pilus biogenesis protein PilO [Candidatus Peregrinibacteria bacterium]